MQSTKNGSRPHLREGVKQYLVSLVDQLAPADFGAGDRFDLAVDVQDEFVLISTESGDITQPDRATGKPKIFVPLKLLVVSVD